jgi:hypothetical protein
LIPHGVTKIRPYLEVPLPHFVPRVPKCKAPRRPAGFYFHILSKRESHHVYLSPMLAEHYRLIPASPVGRDAVAERFKALATCIQARDDCDRVTALQRAIDENSTRFAEYCRAMGR